jgi:hypothetical protein
MKNLYTTFLAVLLTASVFAQSPEKMSYQAVIRNTIDELVASSPVGMQISILQGSVEGEAVYVETQAATTNANGLVTIEIGGGTPVIGTFAEINWSAGPYFIKTETDPTGGTTYTITGTSRLLSVPYALYAKTASSHYVGESYGGGIVFYVFENGQHGLIAATADQSTGAVWTTAAFQSSVSNAVRDRVKGGLTNTERIVLQAGDGSYAAQLCDNYQGGNYADWYLPSKYELNLLYLQRTVVGGFADNGYFSSTELDDNDAWGQDFSSGYQGECNKSDTYPVRAVRAF